MHSTTELASDMFTFAIDGRPASIHDVLPGFDDRDRLGIVVRDPGGAVGASALLLGAITRFYDFQRARSDDFRIYTDYFIFHVGERHGDFNMLDVWPDHKEPVVEDDPERLLDAINDRGITRLLVTDAERGGVERHAASSKNRVLITDAERSGVEFERHAVSSARSRITSALVYAAAGRARDADVVIGANDVTESYVNAALGESSMVPAETRENVRAGRAALVEDGRPTESYRRISLDEALLRL